MSAHDRDETTAELLRRRPVNAWLMVGDEQSWPEPSELGQPDDDRVPTGIWTAPSQAQPGDLLFFYFMAPIKAIRFVARAASHPYFDSREVVMTRKELDRHQWFVTHTPLVEVPALGFSSLEALHGGNLVLRGKPRHYLRPEVVRGVDAQMFSDLQPATALQRQVLQTPSGDPLLPAPEDMTLQQWSAMADGALKLEAQVEEHVVSPLLRLATSGLTDVVFEKQHKTSDGGIVDWVVRRGGSVSGVIEAKVGVAEPSGGRWEFSPDLKQLQRYMEAEGVPGMLIDSKRMFLVERGGHAPSRVLSRSTMTPADLRAVGQHLAG